MKKFLSIFASLLMLASSCGNSVEEFEEIPQMVTLKLDCSFENAATRANNNDLYLQFHQKILSRQLVANQYTLTFTNKETGETFRVDGKFNSNELVSIKVGSYKITGSANASGECIQDKCSIKFDTEAVVTANTSKLVLKADYNCFLLIFDKNVVSDAYVTYVNVWSSLEEKHFFELDNVYYGFSYKLYNENSNVGSQRLTVKYNNNQTEEFTSSNLNTRYGEYYIFDNYVTPTNPSSLNWQSVDFTIDKMTCGRL